MQWIAVMCIGFLTGCVSAMNDRGMHWACFNDDHDQAQELLNESKNSVHNFTLNNVEIRSIPVLFFAKSIKIADLLMRYGADPYQVATYYPHGGETIIHNSMSADYSIPLLKHYIDTVRININTTTANKDTPLHYWARSSLFTSSHYLGVQPYSGYLSIAQEKLKILIAAGANTMLKNATGDTALDVLRRKKLSYIDRLPVTKQERELRNEAFDILALLLNAATRKQIASMPEQPFCVICQGELEESDDRTRLPCTHVFHMTCINSWITLNGICPTCRREV